MAAQSAQVQGGAVIRHRSAGGLVGKPGRNEGERNGRDGSGVEWTA